VGAGATPLVDGQRAGAARPAKAIAVTSMSISGPSS
jgi:hypothetical protein